MKHIRPRLVTLLPVVLFAAPLVALAAGLVPCGDNAVANDYITATSCGLCDFGRLLQNVINFLIVLAVPIAVGLFAWAGVLYFTSAENPGRVERARKIFTSVFIGFAIALSGWLIVQTLLNALVGSNFFAGGGWTDLKCAQDKDRPRTSSIGDIFAPSSVSTPGNTSTGVASGSGSGGGSGQAMEINAFGPGTTGTKHAITFNALQSDVSLESSFTNVWDTYGDQVNAACQSSSIPNCSQVVTALITAESSGNAATPCNGANSCGLMQLSASNGGASCAAGDTACISGQITKGVQYLSQQYATFKDVPNALAAYNGGPSTQAGTSPSGRNPAMAQSVNCPGLYAWQCSTDPGGLTQTQSYVATICRSMYLNGGGCQ